MKTVTFYVTKRAIGGSMSDNDRSPNEDKKVFNESISIPSIDIIQDPRQGKKGKTYIRYEQGEQSIFVDEQRAEFDLVKIKNGTIMPQKIKITNGRIVVSEEDPLLISYLRHTNFNEGAPNRTKRPFSFFEYKPASVSQKVIETKTKEIKLQASILSLPAINQQALARVTGAIQSARTMEDMDISVVTHALLQFATNPEKKSAVESAIEDKFLIPRYVIHKCLDYAEILWRHGSPNDLVWKQGGVIVTVPQGVEDKVGYCAQTLMLNGIETMNLLRKLAGFEILTSEAYTSENPIISTLEGKTREEIAEMMVSWNKENGGVMFTLKGRYYHYGDVQLGADKGGKEGAADFLAKNEHIFNLAYQEWLQKIK